MIHGPLRSPLAANGKARDGEGAATRARGAANLDAISGTY
jgi:hypothetical protein